MSRKSEPIPVVADDWSDTGTKKRPGKFFCRASSFSIDESINSRTMSARSPAEVHPFVNRMVKGVPDEMSVAHVDCLLLRCDFGE